MITRQLIFILMLSLLLLSGIVFLISDIIQKQSITNQLKQMLKLIMTAIAGNAVLICMAIYESIMAWNLSPWFQFNLVNTHESYINQLVIQNGFIIFCVCAISLTFNYISVKKYQWTYLFLSPESVFLMAITSVSFLSFTSLSVAVNGLISCLIVSCCMLINAWWNKKMKNQLDKQNVVLGTFSFIHVGFIFFSIRMLNLSGKPCKDILERKLPWLLRYSTLVVLVGLFILSGMINFSGFDQRQTMLTVQIFNYTVHSNVALMMLQLIVLVVGTVSGYIFYRGYRFILNKWIRLIKKDNSDIIVATSWIYHLQACQPYVVIGFMMSLVGCLVGLYYLTFYVPQYDLIMPNLIGIGLSGIVIAKLSDRCGGITGAMSGAFLHGILLTITPTLSFVSFQSTTLPIYFQQIDYFFISQLLDILFIF